MPARHELGARRPISSLYRSGGAPSPSLTIRRFIVVNNSPALIFFTTKNDLRKRQALLLRLRRPIPHLPQPLQSPLGLRHQSGQLRRLQGKGEIHSTISPCQGASPPRWGACCWRGPFDQGQVVVFEAGDLVGGGAEAFQEVDGGFIKR